MDTMTHDMRMFFVRVVNDLSKVGVTVIDSGVNINFRRCLYFKLGGGRNPNHLLAFLDAVLRHGGTFHGDIGRNLGGDMGEFCLLVSVPEVVPHKGCGGVNELEDALVGTMASYCEKWWFRYDLQRREISVKARLRPEVK